MHKCPPQSQSLAQIGAHRPGNRPRPDHHVPFLILSGLPTRNHVQLLMNRLAQPYRQPLGRRIDKPAHHSNVSERYKRELGSYERWSVPEAVTSKLVHLCRILASPSRGCIPYAQFDPSTHLPTTSLDAQVTMGKDSQEWIMHWGRDEYKHAIDAHNLMWPDFLRHDMLDLFKNRYPRNPTIAAFNPIKYRDVIPRGQKGGSLNVQATV